MKIAVITDIHIGSQDTDNLYKQLKESFFEYVKDYKPDLIVNCGDTTDHKILINSLDAELLMDLGKMMKEAAKDVVIVHGTLSHDMLVYKAAYKHLIDSHFQIFYKASIAHVDKLNLLILPEEYDLKNGYYDQFFNNKITYDFVFGHGMFSHVGAYAKKLLSLNYSTKHARVWDWKEFQNNVYGNVVFGHIHTGSEYKNIIYPGSFSRSSFGEEEPKGFYIFEYDENKHVVIKKEFIENKLAPKYKDVFSEDLQNLEIDDLMKTLRKYSEENFKIRIVINTQVSESFIQNINAFVKNVNNANIIKKIPKDILYLESSQKEKEKIDVINEKLEKFKNKDFYEITKMLSFENFGVEFTNDEINSILNNKD